MLDSSCRWLEAARTVTNDWYQLQRFIRVVHFFASKEKIIFRESIFLAPSESPSKMINYRMKATFSIIFTLYLLSSYKNDKRSRQAADPESLFLSVVNIRLHLRCLD